MKTRLIMFAASLVIAAPLCAQQYTIKFATVAPEGTTWMNVMKEFDRAIRKESGGRLGFKIYPGGVQGDEKDVLRKIRLGQLHSAGITGVGIGEIAPKLRVLDSPFLFKGYGEIDSLHSNFDAEFARAFEQGGYVLLGWAEVGFVYVFTNTPVRTREDMKNVRMWMWEGDPVAEATFKAMGLSPIPLSITDVLTSLQTGLIDGVYTSPLAALGLQWWTRTKYMLDYPLANASGAVVVSKKSFDNLPPDLQQILIRNGRHYMAELTALSRTDNAKSIATLKRNGITIVEPSAPKTLRDYEEIGANARRLLVGRLYSEDFLHRIEEAVKTFRSNSRNSQ